MLGDDLQLPPALGTPCYERSERGPAANRGLAARDGFGGAVVLREIARRGKGGEALRGVLTSLRTYSLTESDSDWLMSFQLDRLPKGQQKWIEANGLYLFSTHKEEWSWNRGELRNLNDQGGRPIANIAARSSGIHSKDAPPDKAGGLLRQTYLRKGARLIVTSAVLQVWGLYDGAIGEVVDIVFRKGERPPASLPAFALVRFPKYHGPVYLADDPNVVPIAPIERLLDCRRRCPRLMIPLAPSRGVTSRKSHGMTRGAGRDAECVVAHPSAPSFGKSHPGGLHTARSRAKPAGRGTYGEPGYEPSALYLHPMCSRERILIRVDNEITAGRERGALRIEKLAADTASRNPHLLQEYGDLVEWAKTPIDPEALATLFGQR